MPLSPRREEGIQAPCPVLFHCSVAIVIFYLDRVRNKPIWCICFAVLRQLFWSLIFRGAYYTAVAGRMHENDYRRFVPLMGTISVQCADRPSVVMNTLRNYPNFIQKSVTPSHESKEVRGLIWKHFQWSLNAFSTWYHVPRFHFPQCGSKKCCSKFKKAFFPAQKSSAY